MQLPTLISSFDAALVPLPINLVDPSQQITQGCVAGGKLATSSFVVTGRGGLPPNPTDVLGSETVVTGLSTLEGKPTTHATVVLPAASKDSTAAAAIVEAQKVVFGPNGEVMLVAETTDASPAGPWYSPDCH